MNPLRSNKGFTLVEIIMTIVIVGIISIIVGPILIQGFNSFFASAGMTDMDAQGKLAMERMSRDIRGITTPATNIHSSSNSNVFRFSLGGNTVRFRRDAPNQAIMRDTLFFILWDSDLLCGLVTNLTFTYFDRNLNQLTLPITPADVWMIQIQFTLAYGGGGFAANKTFRTSVFLRNAP